MAKTKRVLRFYQYNQCDEFAVYLNDMARKGWHFKEFKLGLVFEKGEPEESVYDAVVFSKDDRTDYRPTPDALEFAEYCEAAGWELIDGSSQIYVFRRLYADAEPIMTAEEKVENVWKLSVKENRIWIFLLVFLIGMLCLQYITSFTETVFDSGLLTECMQLFVCIEGCFRVFRALLWRRKWKKEIAEGQVPFIGIQNHKHPDMPVRFDFRFLIYKILMGFVLLLYLYYVCNLITLAFVAGILIIVIGIDMYNCYKRSDHEMASALTYFTIIAILVGSFALTMITQDESLSNAPMLPDQVVKIGPTLEEYYNWSDSKNIFGSHVEWEFSYVGEPDYEYNVYKSPFSLFIKKAWKEELKENKKEDRCEASNTASEWGAKKVYKVADMDYILYDQAVLEITDMDYTPEQISMIREKLGVN